HLPSHSGHHRAPPGRASRFPLLRADRTWQRDSNGGEEGRRQRGADIPVLRVRRKNQSGSSAFPRSRHSSRTSEPDGKAGCSALTPGRREGNNDNCPSFRDRDRQSLVRQIQRQPGRGRTINPNSEAAVVCHPDQGPRSSRSRRSGHFLLNNEIYGAIDNDPRGRYRKFRDMKLKAKVMEAEKNVRLSEGLLAKVANVARAENRTPDELLEDAAELYLKNRRWEKLLEFGENNARNLGLTGEGVPRLIAEARREQEERGR